MRLGHILPVCLMIAACAAPPPGDPARPAAARAGAGSRRRARAEPVAIAAADTAASAAGPRARTRGRTADPRYPAARRERDPRTGRRGDECRGGGHPWRRGRRSRPAPDRRVGGRRGERGREAAAARSRQRARGRGRDLGGLGPLGTGDRAERPSGRRAERLVLWRPMQPYGSVGPLASEENARCFRIASLAPVCLILGGCADVALPDLGITIPGAAETPAARNFPVQDAPAWALVRQGGAGGRCAHRRAHARGRGYGDLRACRGTGRNALDLTASAAGGRQRPSVVAGAGARPRR